MRAWVAQRTAPVAAPKTYRVASGLRPAFPSISRIPNLKLEHKRVFALHGNFHFQSLAITTDLARLGCRIEDRLDWIGTLAVPAVTSRSGQVVPLPPPDISRNVAHSVVNISSDYISENRPCTETFAPELVPKSLVGPDLVTAHPIAIPSITPPIEFSLCPLDSKVLCNRYRQITPPSIRNLPLPDTSKVSRNLYKPFSPVRIVGCRFEEKVEPNEETAFSFSAMNTGFESDIERQTPSWSPDNTHRTDQRQPPIWGYLLAFLKPRLQLDRLRASDLPFALYPFQIEGVKRLISNTAFLLADEMGTGKTVMTSVALRVLLQQGRIHRVIVLCPKSVLSVWHRHLRDWARPLSVVVVSGTKAVREMAWKTPAHVYVSTYDAVRNDHNNCFRMKFSPKHPSAQAGGFDAIVLDEAQAIKNPASGRSKATKAVSEETNYNWALTGTPIQNNVNDLITICHILRIPVAEPRQEHHLLANRLSRFPTVPPSNEYLRRAIEPYFLRRRKQDVFHDLPCKLRTDEWLELDPDQRAEYEAALADGRRSFRSKEKEFTRIHVFALLHRLKRICNFAQGKHHSPKTAAVMEHVEDIVDSGKKVLVFSQYKTEGVSKLKRLLDRFGVVTITGESTDRERIRAVERFQRDANCRVLVATPKTAGEGLTLTAASYVIHFDHWWNPAVAWQAEDRAHRKGQTEAVNVYSFWTVDTVEGRIREILKKKGLLHSEIIDSLSSADFDKALTLDDLLSVLDLDSRMVRMR